MFTAHAKTVSSIGRVRHHATKVRWDDAVDQSNLPERRSVLDDPEGPNASKRTIAVVLTTCAIACILLITLLISAIDVRSSTWTGGDPEADRVAPSIDPQLANRAAKGDASRFFMADDYPVDAMRRGEQGRVVARLTLDPTGKPLRCEITQSSRSLSLDDATFGSRSAGFTIPRRATASDVRSRARRYCRCDGCFRMKAHANPPPLMAG